MLDYGQAFESAFPYEAFLDKYASDEQRRRWEEFGASITLSSEQTALLNSFVREMHVLVLAGTWCGDCVNQCPIFQKFADVNSKIQVRFLDRDDAADVAAELTTCGGARVPAVLFLSEDNQVCGRFGDRTLSKYRAMVQNVGGAACPTGLHVANDLTSAVVQDWLDEFERIQWMLRTSTRLRQLHND